MSKFERIIFVDKTNTILSPFAQSLLLHKFQSGGLDAPVVSSCGVSVLFPEPVAGKMSEAAEEFGVSFDGHKASSLLAEDFADATLVLVFDAASSQYIFENFENAVNVFLFTEYIGESGDIVPPLGGTLEEYKSLCAELDRMTDTLFLLLTAGN